MADSFDPSQQPANTPTKSFYSQAGMDYHHPSYNSIWKRQSSTDVNNSTFLSGEQQQQTQSASNKIFNIFNSLNRSLGGSNSFDYSTQNSFPPSNVNNHSSQRLPTDSGQNQVHNTEQRNEPYSGYTEYSSRASNENPSESYPSGDYEPAEASTHYQEEYYDYQKPHKKKGLYYKLDRLLQRIPTLGKTHKQLSTSFDRSGSFQHNQSSSIDSNQVERELTADELALNSRYTDKTRMKSIDLQQVDHTQPVDIRIHHDTNTIYVCDIGRSVVEIYDINGTRQHIIEDSTITKFQPTAIAVAFDGTIIIASHFNHCLHMYSPSDSKNVSNCHTYKQFKLGSPGDQIHQFYHPAGIAIDRKDGNLYVCDRGNYRIQVIRPEGMCERVIELLLNAKKKHKLDPIRVAIQSNFDRIVCIIGQGDAICFLPKQSTGRVYVDPLYISDENGLGLEGASGIAVDIHDRIIISDTVHQRIVICTPEGGYITSFGTEGADLGQLKRPCGLDVTSNGTLVVTDPGNKRIQLFGIIQEQTNVEDKPPQENSTDTEHEYMANL